MSETFADEPTPIADRATPPPSAFRRYAIAFIVIGGLLLVGGGTLMLVVGNRRLRDAFAEADRLDPGWRYDDVDARRARVSDAENSALVVIAAAGKMPQGWPEWDLPAQRELLADPAEEDLPPPEPLPPPAAQGPPPGHPLAEDEPGPGGPPGWVGFPAAMPPPIDENAAFQEALSKLPPPVKLTSAQAERIRAELRRAAGTLAQARSLADMPRGRHPVTVSRDWISTLLPTVQHVRTVAYPLSFDALIRADEGDLDGALVSCRAILNASSSLGDEPSLICVLVRIAVRAIGRAKIERVLAQGEPSIEALEALQARLEQEAEEPLLLIGLRGERAGMDMFFEALQRGDFKVSQMRGIIAGGPGGGKAFDRHLLLHLPGTVAASRAAMLRRMTEAVEIIKLPAHEQFEPMHRWEAGLRAEPPLVRELAPAISKVAGASWRSQAEFRCAAAALSAERFRRKEGRWPKDLAELVPAYLKAVPLDPFDGKPLRYRFDAEGVVIYSTGPDRKDDGGSFDTLNTHKDGTDLGFRLYEPSRRGRPQP